jgi:hypothetical protein
MEQTWRKSSYSAANGGACIEVASGEAILVRDTTNRDGGTLSFPASVWANFTSKVKRVLPETQPGSGHL